MPQDTLLAFIEQSSLPDEDKMFWKHASSILSGEQLSLFEQYINGDRKRLTYVTNNIKRKRDAFISGDTSALTKIVEEEKTVIQQQ